LTQNTESSSRRDRFPEQYDGQTGQPEFSAVWAYIPKVEEHAGRSKAEARLGAMHVLAERDAAMAEHWVEPPPLPPGGFAQLIEAVIADVLPPAVQEDVTA